MRGTTLSFFLSAVVIAAVFPAGAGAVTNATCDTLQNAMDTVPDGEVIQLQDETCTNKSYTLPDAATTGSFEIRGAPTTFDGADPAGTDPDSVFERLGGTDIGNVTFRDLTFENLAPGHAAIRAEAQGVVTIADSTFADYQESSGVSDSHALYLSLSNGGGATITGSTFLPDGAASTDGDGVIIFGGGTTGPPVRVEGSTFGGMNNAGSGAALEVRPSNRAVDIVGNDFLDNVNESRPVELYVSGANPVWHMTDNFFAGNRATASVGGALGLTLDSSTADFTQSDNRFIDNGITASGASRFGGAERVVTYTTSAKFLSRGDVFTDNFSEGNSGNEGGALWMGGCLNQGFNVENAIFSGNRVADHGEGSAIYIGCGENANTLNLVNSTLTDNTGAPAIDGGEDDTLNLRNTIAHRTPGGNAVSDFQTVTSAYSNACAPNVDTPYPGEGNQCTDPQLADFVPTLASPMRNKGSNALVPAGLTTDVFGNPRVAEGTVDIGAAEYIPALPVNPPTPDRTPPAVTSASLTNKKFRVAKAATPIAAAKKKRKRAKAGTRVNYTLNEAGAATFLIERKLAGRRSGKKCVAPKRKLRKKKKCSRYKKAGTLTRRSLVGNNRLSFSGRIGKKALKRGSYRMTITAKDAAGNTSKPKRLNFKIVK